MTALNTSIAIDKNLLDHSTIYGKVEIVIFTTTFISYIISSSVSSLEAKIKDWQDGNSELTAYGIINEDDKQITFSEKVLFAKDLGKKSVVAISSCFRICDVLRDN